eukprot:5037022-Pleurochrysis_carterae.AAC.1
MEDWQRELVARKWLKNNNLWWCSVVRLENTFWHHFLTICRQPAGRADGTRGSQQCYFEMELWDRRIDHILEFTSSTGFTCLPRMRYSVGASGEVEWVPSRSIDTFYMADRHQMAAYV